MIQRIAKTVRYPESHPITGAPLRPLGHRRDGTPIFPIMGGAEGDGGEGGEGEGEGSSEESGSEGQEGKEGKENGEDKASYTSEEYAALKERMKAADRRASIAEAKEKERVKGEQTELQRAQSEVTEHKEAATTLASQVRTLQVEVAFLKANDVSWHDPEAALRLADLSEVIDEDGDIDKAALKKVLADLAKDKPYLVKKTETESEEEEDEKPASGGNVGTGKKKKDGLDEAALAKKYPAIVR